MRSVMYGTCCLVLLVCFVQVEGGVEAMIVSDAEASGIIGGGQFGCCQDTHPGVCPLPIECNGPITNCGIVLRVDDDDCDGCGLTLCGPEPECMSQCIECDNE